MIIRNLNNEKYLRRIIGYAEEAYLWAEGEVQVFSNYTVKTIIEQVGSHHEEISLSLKTVKDLLREKIELYLLMYKKEELIVVLLMFKAQFRVRISSGEMCDYEMATRHKEILILIQILLNPMTSKVGTKSLMDGTKNLAVSFALVKEFSILIDNIEHFNNSESDKIDLQEFFIPGRLYSEDYNKYMETFFEVSELTNPEDILIESDSIRKIVYEEKLNPECLRNKLSSSIENIYGFNLEQLNIFTLYGMRTKPSLDYIVMHENEYFDLIKDDIGNDRTAFDGILRTFSINTLNYDEITEESSHETELKSIVKFDDFIFFLPFDMVYNTTCFEKFMMKNHFMHFYNSHLSEEARKKLKSTLDGYASNITTYLSYVLMDKLKTVGYEFPIKNGVKQVEIKSIVVDNRINILKTDKDYGDIDVLAINYSKKEILNLEIKHYSPAMSLSKLNSTTEINKRKEHIKKVHERERVLNDNLQKVLKYFDKDNHDEGEYIVRSVFLTIRPDYWLETMGFEVEYYTLVDFLKEFNISF